MYTDFQNIKVGECFFIEEDGLVMRYTKTSSTEAQADWYNGVITEFSPMYQVLKP